jgi:hypothetical protein
VWTALLSKELRECGLYAGLALLAQIHYLGAGMDLPLIPFLDSGRGQEIPFLYSYSGNRETTFVLIAIITAIVLGLHQTLWESWRQTTLFLLHRPMPRSQILLGKLLAGVLLLLAVTALPLLVYCLWAATPGTHASPFFGGMTEPWWRAVGVGLVCYFGAFLTGLRPAYWLGSRTWPLITALVLSLGLKLMPLGPSLAYPGLLVLMVCLVISILDTARRREFP